MGRRQAPHKAETGRAFGYVRVSTDRQGEEGFSIPDQEKRLRGYAESRGLHLVQVFIDAGVSGGKRLERRPKGVELLAVLEPGDHVCALKLDRMFRSATDALNVAEDFRSRGIHLHLIDIGGEVTGDGVSKLVFQILAAVAEMERSRIGERVRSVKQHLRDAGYFTGGKMAVGFHRTREGRIVQNEDWSRCLHLMEDLRRKGLSYRQIAARVKLDLAVEIGRASVHRILNGRRDLDSSPAAAPMPVAQSTTLISAEPANARVVNGIYIIDHGDGDRAAEVALSRVERRAASAKQRRIVGIPRRQSPR